MVSAAIGPIAVIAASGIQEHNVSRLIAKTGVREIHVGLNDSVPSPMRFHNEKISTCESLRPRVRAVQGF